MKRRLPILLLLVGYASLATAQTGANSKPLTAKPGEEWVIRWNRSDDFKGDEVDWRKWNKKPEKFGIWSWDNQNNVSVSEGILTITLRCDQDHNSGESGKKESDGPPVAFTSGMLKSYATGTYGYYEARIKGAPLFPGVCPAFWLYSRIDDSVLKQGEVRYSEIDIVELTQRQSEIEGNEKITDHNLHTILSNGNQGLKGRAWRRPHDPRYKEAQALEYRAPFDPRSGFHTYGCLVGKDLIKWYVDGVEIGQKKNDFWHRKMNVALSLGVRAPYAVFENNRLNPARDQPAGDFPTSMQIDYVRVWELEAAGD